MIQTWEEQVGKVFTTSPRGHLEDVGFWLTREEEHSFKKLLRLQGNHVCLDGPTGTGKTSLAERALTEEGMLFSYVPITKNTTWVDFCKEFFRCQTNVEEVTEKNSNISSGFPQIVTGEKSWKKTKTSSPGNDLEYTLAMSKCSTEHDLARHIREHRTSVLIDDFEKANDTLIQRIADLCKILTRTGDNDKSKIVIVGTADIYRRLYSKDNSLGDRLHQYSLGTLPNRGYSWKLLLMGFEALGIRHPAISRIKSEKDRLNECVNAVYTAANGLPKSLNKLGAELAFKTSSFSKSVTSNDIIQVCQKIPVQWFREYKNTFPKLVDSIKDPMVRTVMDFLYKEGIGRIHTTDRIYEEFEDTYEVNTIDSAIHNLEYIDFITITGKHNDIIFVNKPDIAHMFNVMSANPSKYGRQVEKIFAEKQLTLPLRSKKA